MGKAASDSIAYNLPIQKNVKMLPCSQFRENRNRWQVTLHQESLAKVQNPLQGGIRLFTPQFIVLQRIYPRERIVDAVIQTFIGGPEVRAETFA
jgi:hypothetical protein